MHIPRIIAGFGLLTALPLAACSDYGIGGDRPGYNSGEGYNNGGAYTLRDKDRIYRDSDGRYYCRKPNGSTGLIVGGLAGGALGNVIAPGGSKTLGTILGAGVGAVAGRAIDRNAIRCE